MNARYVQPGDLVAGAYRLDGVVGQGRSGIVFGARDERSGARVAIKFLRGELAHDRALASAFVALARLAARLTGWRIDIVSESQAAEQAGQGQRG